MSPWHFRCRLQKYKRGLYHGKQLYNRWIFRMECITSKQCCRSGSVSGSVSHKHGSWSGSFHHQAKRVRKTLISTFFWLLCLFIFEEWCKCTCSGYRWMFLGLPDPHPDPLVRVRIRVFGSAFRSVPKCHGSQHCFQGFFTFLGDAEWCTYYIGRSTSLSDVFLLSKMTVSALFTGVVGPEIYYQAH